MKIISNDKFNMIISGTSSNDSINHHRWQRQDYFKERDNILNS